MDFNKFQVICRPDLVVLLLLGVASGITFGIVLPSMKMYTTSETDDDPPGLGQSNSFYALLVSMFSVGEFIGSNMGGVLSQDTNTRKGMSSKWCIVTMGLVGITGSFLFAIASSDYWFLALIGRLGTGIWSGGVNLTIRTHVNSTVPQSDYVFVMASLAFFITLAIMLSPGMQALFEILPSGCISGTEICVDSYRYPGWTILVVVAAATLLVLVSFPDQEKYESAAATSTLQSPLLGPILSTERASDQPMIFWNTNGIPNSVVAVLLLCFFTVSFGFTVIEAMSAPIMNDQLGIDVEKSGILFFTSGVVSALSFLVLLVADKRNWVTDTQAIMISLLFMLLGSIALVDYQSLGGDSCEEYTCSFSPSTTDCDSSNNITTLQKSCELASDCVWNPESCPDCAPVCHNPNKTIHVSQLYIGFVLFNVQYVLGRICVAAVYSKLMPNKNQGWMQSALLSSGTIARVVAPFVGMAAYEGASHRTFALMFILMGLSLVCVSSFVTKVKAIDTLVLRADLTKATRQQEEREQEGEFVEVTA